MKRRLPELKISNFIFGVLICLLYLCGSADAQSGAQTRGDATLAGVVTDAGGRPISGARIVVTRVIVAQTGGATQFAFSVETQSHDDGNFSIALEAGTYRVAITRDSFTRIEREAVLSAGQKVEWKLRMEIEPLAAGIVVTAQATPMDVASTPAPVTVITREKIEQREATSLPDLLSSLPGISMARTGAEGGLTTLFLDGGNSNYAKVLVDGAPVTASGGFIDFSNLTLDNIEKIEIVHGAESALYGSDAMTGAVQIFTKRGTTQTPELEVVGDGGSFSTGNGSATVSGLLGRFDYLGGFGYLTTAGQGTNDFMLNRTYSGNFGYKFSDMDTLRVSIRDNASDAGIPGQTVFIPPDPTQTNDRQDFSGNAVWNAQAGPHWQWRVSANESSQLSNDNDPLEFFDAIDQFNRASADAQGTYLFKVGAATAGYTYEIENAFPSALDGLHVQRRNQAGYLDARWQPTKRLTVNAGARADDNSVFGTKVEPRVGASYLLREGSSDIGETRVHAFYGQGIVEPQLSEIFGTDPCFRPNPSLAPEESKTANGGIDQNLMHGRLTLSADYFYNQFHDIISFAFDPAATSTCPFGTGMSVNTDRAVARGVNFSGELHPVRWLRLAGHYSYDDSRVLFSPNAGDQTETPGNHLLRRPVNSGTLEANVSVRRLNLNALGYFSGARTDSDFLGLGLTRDPGYARLDCALSYRVRRELSLFIRGTNLLNKQYQDALGFPALGRQIVGGVKLTFGGE
ncbi:MAG: TonB-dependent receptor [Candidatus Acidiferrales bacterium]